MSRSPANSKHRKPAESRGSSPPEARAAPQRADDAADSHELVPGGVQRLVELFGTDLEGIEFPGFGAAALEQATDELRVQTEAVHAARQQLESAEAELERARDSLLRLARQGLAYLRVYAMNQNELLEKLATIDLDPGRRTASRQRTASKPREPSAGGEASSREKLDASVSGATNGAS